MGSVVPLRLARLAGGANVDRGDNIRSVACEARAEQEPRALRLGTRAFAVALVAAAILFAFPVFAHAATLTLYPTAQDTSSGRTGDWTISPANSWGTSLRSDDGGTSYASGPSSDAANVFLMLDSVTPPPGTITGVTVTVSAATSGAWFSDGTMKLGVAGPTGSAALQATAQTVSSSTYGAFTYSAPTNPGGGAWSWSDISSLRAVVQQTTRPSLWGFFYGQLRVSQAYVTVTYTPTYTITSSAGANGSISPSGGTAVSEGGSQSYTITPSTGYHVADVTVDGVSQGAITSYAFNNVTSDHTIAASFAINTYTIATSAGAHGTVTPSSPTVNYGANQTFLITPDSGCHVVDVVVDGVSQGAIGSYTFYSVTSSGHTISATFAINTYTITTSPGTNGTITPASPGVVEGDDQTLAITPNTGYHVADVVVDGVSQGAIGSYTFHSVSANHTIAASFAINTYTITTNPGAHGTISPSSPSVNFGSNQTLSIAPDTGYHVASVVVDGVSLGSVTSYTFTNVMATHTISATFAINTYTITTNPGAHGTITPSSPGVADGDDQTLAITPDTGYHVADVVVDGVSMGAVTSYTFYNISANHTIAASFAINTYTITTNPGAHGTISPSSPSVSQGADQTFLIAADSNYHVVDVVVDGVSQGAIGSYTFYNVTSSGHTISATFAMDGYVITTSPGPGGTISPSSPTVPNGGGQSFTITPNTGYHIADVTVDGVSMGAIGTYTFTNVTSSRTIAATFAINTYAITTSAGAHGTISPSSATVNYGANQTFSITASAGYHVSSVVVDGVSLGATTSYTFTNVTAPHTIAATFAVDTFTITTSPGPHGTITPSSPGVAEGDDQAVTIAPYAGYHIVDVVVDGVSQGAITTYTFLNVTANHTVSATFAINTYTITTSSGPHGSISPISPTVDFGASQTFTIAADSGYHVAGVTVDGVSQGAIGSYTFISIMGNHTISASFVASAPPCAVLSAISSGVQSVDVAFTQQLVGSSVQASDFSIAGLSITSAALQPDGVTVRLMTSQQMPGRSYLANVAVGSVVDVNAQGLVAPNTAPFTGHTGPWVEAVPSAGLTLNFSHALVAGPGATAVVPPSRQPAPFSYSLLDGSYYDVSTTTQFSGTVTIAMSYNPSDVTGSPSNLRLFHWKNGAWQDITSYVNTSNDTVVGVTDSFSDFTIGEPTESEGSGGIGGTSTPASSDWSLALLGAVGVGLLLVHRRTKKDAPAR